jgi:sugar phosphate isomerase/epimerase
MINSGKRRLDRLSDSARIDVRREHATQSARAPRISRLGVTSWTLGLPDDPPARAAELGFAIVHVAEVELVGDGPRVELARADAYAGRAAAAGVAVTAVAASRLERVGLASQRAAEEALSCAIGAAAHVDAGLAYAPSFEAAEIRDGDDLSRTARLLRSGLAAARGTGVRVATESTLGPAELRSLLDLVDDPDLLVLFDTQNPTLWGHDPLELLDEVAAALAPAVHVKDGAGGEMGNARIGAGEANVGATLTRLRELGFSGDLVLESEYGADAEARVLADVRALHALLGTGADE